MCERWSCRMSKDPFNTIFNNKYRVLIIQIHCLQHSKLSTSCAILKGIENESRGIVYMPFISGNGIWCRKWVLIL